MDRKTVQRESIKCILKINKKLKLIELTIFMLYKNATCIQVAIVLIGHTWSRIYIWEKNEALYFCKGGFYIHFPGIRYRRKKLNH